MSKPEPPPSYMPANMYKERETHYLVVGEQVFTPEPVEVPKVQNNSWFDGWENFSWQ